MGEKYDYDEKRDDQSVDREGVVLSYSESHCKPSMGNSYIKIDGARIFLTLWRTRQPFTYGDDEPCHAAAAHSASV
jgi:hypothetical protein